MARRTWRSDLSCQFPRKSCRGYTEGYTYTHHVHDLVRTEKVEPTAWTCWNSPLRAAASFANGRGIVQTDCSNLLGWYLVEKQEKMTRILKISQCRSLLVQKFKKTPFTTACWTWSQKDASKYLVKLIISYPHILWKIKEFRRIGTLAHADRITDSALWCRAVLWIGLDFSRMRGEYQLKVS